MIPQYNPTGAMTLASNGAYVACSDYERMRQSIIKMAADYCQQIEAGELTAEAAKDALCGYMRLTQ